MKEEYYHEQKLNILEKHDQLQLKLENEIKDLK